MDDGASSYRRYLAGENDALTDLVSAYKDGLILYLFGIVRDLDLAEELMEETFFKLITKKPRFEETYSFKTWLYTVGRNLAMDHFRRSRKTVFLPDGEASEIPGEEKDLAEVYLKEERKQILFRAMRRLSPDYREILWLIYFEDLSLDRARKVMKKSPRQAKNLHYRAKNALKNELNKEGFTDENV